MSIYFQGAGVSEAEWVPCLSPAQVPLVTPKPIGSTNRLAYCQVLPTGPPFPLKSPQEAFIDSLPAVSLPPKRTEPLSESNAECAVNQKESAEQPDTTSGASAEELEKSEEKKEPEEQKVPAGGTPIAPEASQPTAESAVVPIVDSTDVELVVKPSVSLQTKESAAVDLPQPEAGQKEEPETQVQTLEESCSAVIEEDTISEENKEDEAPNAPEQKPAKEDAQVAATEMAAESASIATAQPADGSAEVIENGLKNIDGKAIVEQNDEKKALDESTTETQAVAIEQNDISAKEIAN